MVRICHCCHTCILQLGSLCQGLLQLPFSFRQLLTQQSRLRRRLSRHHALRFKRSSCLCKLLTKGSGGPVPRLCLE
jgi:hypothetical protein